MLLSDNNMYFRFAIIGCGKIADRHASIMQQYGKIVAVCDIDKLKTRTFAAKYKSNPYNSNYSGKLKTFVLEGNR